MGIEISLCMIVKNEENNLVNCLESVRGIVEEINIVDTGSTDNTIEIAKRYTDRIYHFDWIDDFSAARNFSFSKATKKYIFWLDADDIITQENQEKLIALKHELPSDVDYVTMKYHYCYDENGNVMEIAERERLIKRERGFLWMRPIHEAINVSGKCLKSDIFITHVHKKGEISVSAIARNLRILEKAVNIENPSWLDLYYYGISLNATGEYDKALEIILRMIATPNNRIYQGTHAYLAAHEIYCIKGENEKALHILLDNEHIFNDKSEFYCTLGDFYLNTQKEYDKAYESYCKALACKGDDRPGNCVERRETYYYFMPYYKLGMLCCTLKMYKEAVQFLEKALVYNQLHEETTSMLSKLWRLLQLTEL